MADETMTLEQVHDALQTLLTPTRVKRTDRLALCLRIQSAYESAIAERKVPECVHVVCKWKGDTCEFVECELDDGHSVSIEWRKRTDGYDELRLFRMTSAQQVKP